MNIDNWNQVKADIIGKKYPFLIKEKDMDKYSEQFKDLFYIDRYYRSLKSDDADTLFASEPNYPKKAHRIWDPKYINLDTGFILWKLIFEHKMKSVLNFGTGAGSSIVYSAYAMKDDIEACVDSLEHIHKFTEVASLIINNIKNSGLSLGKYNLINTGFSKFDTSSSSLFASSLFYKYTVLGKTRNGNHKRSGKRSGVDGYWKYDFVPDKKYDMIIVDGPSVYRIPSMLQYLPYIKEDGFVVFEGGRSEVPLLKLIGLDFLEYGKPMRAGDVKFPLFNNKKVSILSTTIFQMTKKNIGLLSMSKENYDDIAKNMLRNSK